MQPESFSAIAETISAYVALAMAAGALVMTVWKASWGAQGELAERDRRFYELADALQEKVQLELGERDRRFYALSDDLQEKIQTKIERSERMVGESMSAIREKVTQVELWNRDNLSRRSEVTEAMASMRAEMQNLVQSFMLRLDHKLDDIGRKLDEGKR